MTDEELAGKLALLPDLAQADPDLLRRGRHLTVDMMIGVGSVPVRVAVTAGRVASVSAGPKLMASWRFAVRGTARAWEAYWQPVPAPGWHDLFALSKRGELEFEGDLQPLVANLQFIKDLLALPRTPRNAP